MLDKAIASGDANAMDCLGAMYCSKVLRGEELDMYELSCVHTP